VQFLGWSYVLFLITWHFAQGHPYSKLWPVIRKPLTAFQSLMILEIVHALLGVVSANVVTTLIQVFSRVLLVWGIVVQFPVCSSHWLLATMTSAWAVTEVIRYAFYTLALLKRVPGFLSWLRYSTFYLLYPIGGGSEAGLVLVALPLVHQTLQWSVRMPNAHNFAFDYYWFLLVFVALYVYGLPMMIFHMHAQRRAYFSKQRETTAEKKHA